MIGFRSGRMYSPIVSIANVSKLANIVVSSFLCQCKANRFFSSFSSQFVEGHVGKEPMSRTWLTLLLGSLSFLCPGILSFNLVLCLFVWVLTKHSEKRSETRKCTEKKNTSKEVFGLWRFSSYCKIFCMNYDFFHSRKWTMIHWFVDK